MQRRRNRRTGWRSRGGAAASGSVARSAAPRNDPSVRQEKLAAAVLARCSLRFLACAAVVTVGVAVALALLVGLAPAVAASVFLATAVFMATRP